MTQEFHISITPVRDNEYLVRTEQVAPGVPLAEEQVIWPVDQWLEQTRQLMHDPLVGLLQGQKSLTSGDPEPSPSSVSVHSFMDLGQQLYNNLFQGILRDSWMTAQGIAQHRGEVLRLRLGLKGNQLPRLPWEVMHSHRRDGLGLATHPLATGINLLFSRYQPDRHMLRSGMALTPATSSVLKILMVIALPVDQDNLDLDQEARHLQQELRLQPGHLQGNLIGSLPDIQVTILKHPSRTQLAHALEQSQYQVLHYAGHSDIGSDGGKLYLVDQNGLAETLHGDDLAGLLVNNGIQMAVFNSCRGGHTAADSAEPTQRTLTDALVSRGIPAVLAMAERIPDDVALTLTRLFYRNLKQGYPVDLSLSRARQGLLAAYGSNQLYWALPTLYLHPDFDGYLTAGDRVLDNPADSFARIPPGYAPSLVEPGLESNQIAASAPLPSLEAYQNGAILTDEQLDYDAVDEQAFQTEATQVMSLGEGGAFPSATDNTNDIYNDFEEFNPRYNDDEFLMSADEMAELMSHATPGQDSQPMADNVQASVETDDEVVSGLLNQVNQEPTIRQNSPPQSAVEASPPKAQTSAALVHQPQARAVQSRPNQHQNTNRAPAEQQGTQLRSPTAAALPSSPRHAGALQPVGPASRTDSGVRRHHHRRSRQPQWLYPLAGAAAVMIAFVGYRALNDFSPSPSPVLPPTPQLIVNAENSLSDQNLDEARDWLDQVPKDDIDEPRVAFLQGRLIWELRKAGDPEFDLEEARRHWEHAAQTAGDDPQYYNALGFALYAEGHMNEAVEAWLKSLEILGDQGFEVELKAVNLESPSIETSSETISNIDALTAYAGMALAFAQLAGESSTPRDLVSEVVRIQQVIRKSSSAVEFEPDQLAQNWLWTESAIKEWQLLSQLQSQ